MNRQTYRRRRFLKKALAALGTLGLASGCSSVRLVRARNVDPEKIKRFGASLKGQLILPTDPAYEHARRLYHWNAQTERRPTAIARCADDEDVVLAIEFARKHALEIAVRAGGHSIQGWSTSDGLVIDLSGMKQISIDSTQRIGRVEAGTLAGEFVWVAGQDGLTPILGQCPGVGVAGVTLGGGLGWLTGLHGAACDKLVSARLVTADGHILMVSSTTYPDLFWGIRGGSGNFGVVTALEHRLCTLGPVTAGEIRYPIRDARAVLRFFRDCMAGAPDAFQATISLESSSHSVAISLCHSGDEAEAEGFLGPFRAVVTPSSSTVKRQDYAKFAGRPPTADGGRGLWSGFSCSRGLFRQGITDEGIAYVIDRMETAPPETVIGISHYMHGEVCRVKPDEVAFSLREPGGVHVRIGLEWNHAGDGEGRLAWAEETWRLFPPTPSERIYANYQSFEGKGAAEAVFGVNHPRMLALKKRYDPTNVFRRNSNVQPTRL